MYKHLIAAAAILSFSTGFALSEHRPGHTAVHGDDEDEVIVDDELVTLEGVVISETVEVDSESVLTMGNSGKAPPNERAAQSAGARETTTTTTTTTYVIADVTGPEAELDAGNYDCDTCEVSNETTETEVEVETTTTRPNKN